MFKWLIAFVFAFVGAGVVAKLALPSLGVAFVLGGVAVSWHLVAALVGGFSVASMVK